MGTIGVGTLKVHVSEKRSPHFPSYSLTDDFDSDSSIHTSSIR